MRSMHLNRILRNYPGRDGVVLYVSHSDGHTYRADLPLSVDSRNQTMRSELRELFGMPVWKAS